MLPDTNYRPSGLLQTQVGVSVPLNVASELLGPPERVGFGDEYAFWTSVPKASVNEDSDAPAWESDVHRPPDSL